MKILYVIFFLLLSLSGFSQSQESIVQKSNFKILIEQGNVFQYFKISPSKKKRKHHQEPDVFKIDVLAGNSIPKNFICEISQGGYLVLMHNTSGTLLEFLNEGKIDIDSLEQHYKPSFLTISPRDLNRMALNTIIASQTDFTKYKERYELGSLAPVNRGCRCAPSDIAAYLFNEGDVNMETFDQKAQERYMSVFNEKDVVLRVFPRNLAYFNYQKFTYLVRVMDFYGKMISHKEILVSITSPEAVIHLDLDALKKYIKYDLSFIVELSIKERKEPVKERVVYNINVLEPEKKKEIQPDSSVSLEPKNILDNLGLAFFYESENLYIDATRHYEELIAKRPHVEAFQILYDDFKVRNNMRTVFNPSTKGYHYQHITPATSKHLKPKYQKISR